LQLQDVSKKLVVVIKDNGIVISQNRIERGQSQQRLYLRSSAFIIFRQFITSKKNP
jgi:hypothetical protein